MKSKPSIGGWIEIGILCVIGGIGAIFKGEVAFGIILTLVGLAFVGKQFKDDSPES